ncbi:hypothetical protein DFH09DRAFT_1321474 [Mycena vulgaris]|nr:hypothetical protein DFH09DRAFT_1321474 [Mycena vulgaris]
MSLSGSSHKEGRGGAGGGVRGEYIARYIREEGEALRRASSGRAVVGATSELLVHYLASIALAWLFFLAVALFRFSCLSSLGLFANERILFIRERANGYYSTFTYFSSKVLFDILPLRVVPPIMFGGIKFMLILVLFNLTTSMVVLFLSVAVASASVAGLAGTLVMLFKWVLTVVSSTSVADSVPVAFRWLHTVSFFHAAFEAPAYGVELDVPAALILSTFGLRAQWPNTVLLAIFFTGLTAASYLTLHFFVKEKR